VIEPLAGLIISKFYRATLVFDIVKCDWFETFFRKRIAKRLLSAADLRLTPSHSMELLLGVTGLPSARVPDVPDHLFRSDSSEKSEIASILNTDPSSLFVGVFIETFPCSWFGILSDVAKRVTTPATFLLFGDAKGSIKLPSKQVQTCKFVFVPKQYQIYPAALKHCAVGVS
jgi:hypothetical protein